jgi:hypothetical protein
MPPSEILGFARILIKIRQEDGIFSFERLLTGRRAIVSHTVEYHPPFAFSNRQLGALRPGNIRIRRRSIFGEHWPDVAAIERTVTG